ncbi:outer membrane beta-barrel protein [Polaribacter sp. Hel1_85]|uniref:outer membrane beta-barrel protein n=1 Tax=Polaribacter sp. Hel1_85 TaxID=1250005 RepID=UPI00052DDDB4|nr:outer membrane beta-barrel protein [Polaribacter sp. Hel1_85]KGL62546.1 hypothetical protein PHEL85_2340 [Polaribacter sp. Hel1_85]
MNQNNLDKLFQEQLKNLEVTPNKEVWNKIESKLKKKKRRIVPLWWFASGGVAALLLLGLLLFPFSSKENDLIKIDSETIITESSKEKVKKETKLQTKIDSVFQEENNEEKVFVADKKTNTKQIKKNKNIEKKKELVSTKNAMKKIFLADNSLETKINSSEEEKVIIDDIKEIVSKKKDVIKQNEINKLETESITNKVDLNEFVDKKDSVSSNRKIKRKWSIAPVFAVLNSNSFSDASPVNNNLSNSTKGKSSFSYGFQVGYNINKKWTIQTGIHVQEMNFVNNQVIAVSSISKNSSSVAFNNGESFSFEEVSLLSSDFASNATLKTGSFSGDLNQNYGYIEIPIEIKYTFLETNKVRTQIVTGFSSLFLNKNEVNLNTQFLSKSGEATNLNNINFSGNLGLDINYSINKKWSLNLNPMFKAQLNTFSKNSNGFAPFNIGVYSGVKYTF